MKIAESFYQTRDVIAFSKSLLGKYLFTNVDGKITGGYIVETEAYNGIIDKASYAYGNRLSASNKPMFSRGGIAYVVLVYGIHEMFNIVSSIEGEPHGTLIRAVHPTEGIDTILQRRGLSVLKPRLTSGPGSLTKSLAISRAMNSLSLQGDTVWLEDRGLKFTADQVVIAPRVGVNSAGEDAFLPYRFYVKGDKFVSKPHA